MKSIIYFTKEDGQNKLLLTGSIHEGDPQSLDYFDRTTYNTCTKVLGHKPSNIYIFVDGHEFKVLRSWIKP